MTSSAGPLLNAWRRPCRGVINEHSFIIDQPFYSLNTVLSFHPPFHPIKPSPNTRKQWGYCDLNIDLKSHDINIETDYRNTIFRNKLAPLQKKVSRFNSYLSFSVKYNGVIRE